ncbi:unnamed protein product [Laminaria digitata]
MIAWCDSTSVCRRPFRREDNFKIRRENMRLVTGLRGGGASYDVHRGVGVLVALEPHTLILIFLARHVEMILSRCTKDQPDGLTCVLNSCKHTTCRLQSIAQNSCGAPREMT